MCGITVVNRLKIKRYTAQHLCRDDRIMAERVCGREDLHGFEKELGTARASSHWLSHDKYFPKG